MQVQGRLLQLSIVSATFSEVRVCMFRKKTPCEPIVEYWNLYVEEGWKFLPWQRFEQHYGQQDWSCFQLYTLWGQCWIAYRKYWKPSLLYSQRANLRTQPWLGSQSTNTWNRCSRAKCSYPWNFDRLHHQHQPTSCLIFYDERLASSRSNLPSELRITSPVNIRKEKT